MGARHVVVLVIVPVLLRGVDLFVESGPLEPVAGALAETGITARLQMAHHAGPAQRIAHRAGYVAVTAADLHGVGRDDAARLTRAVGKRHDLLRTGVEQKAAEVDPRSAAHGLIYGEAAVPSEVMHRILRVVSVLRSRIVAHVNGVFAPFGNVGRPHGAALRPAGHRSHAARRAVPEGILSRRVDLLHMREAHAARLPFLRPLLLAVLPGGIVVRQYLVLLHVAFAGQHHAGPGIFEHRNQIRQHVALGIEVLAGLPQLRTLPFPAVLGLVEIAAVTLPQGDMPPGESLRRHHGRRRTGHQRPLGAVGKGHDLLLAQKFPVFRPGSAGHRNQLADLPLVGIKFDVRLAELRRQEQTHRVAHGAQVLFAERIVRKTDRGVDSHPLARGVHPLDADIAARHFAGDDARQRASDFAARRAVDSGGRDLLPAQTEQQENIQQSIFHVV